jgi:hypothetical protein
MLTPVENTIVINPERFADNDTEPWMMLPL